jgi:hypothetical protein
MAKEEVETEAASRVAKSDELLIETRELGFVPLAQLHQGLHVRGVGPGEWNEVLSIRKSG